MASTLVSCALSCHHRKRINAPDTAGCIPSSWVIGIGAETEGTKIQSQARPRPQGLWSFFMNRSLQHDRQQTCVPQLSHLAVAVACGQFAPIHESQDGAWRGRDIANACDYNTAAIILSLSLSLYVHGF